MGLNSSNVVTSRTSGSGCSNNGLLVILMVSLFVVGVPSVSCLTPPSAIKKAYFGLEGFIAKRKVNQDLDPTATKFLVDSDEDFRNSIGEGEQSKSNSDRAASFDHSLWDMVLKKHANYRGTVEGITTNLVDYRGIAKDPYFDLYLKALATVDLETLLQRAAGSSESNNELLALYINAYNCLCIGHVTKYYKASRKKELPPSINAVTKTMKDYRGKDIWDVPAGIIGGKKVSLNDIEHKILRSLWEEPRVHASIVCASLSCPNLRPEAFVAERINAQMNDQAKAWVSDSTKGINIDTTTRQVTMSRIFLWFKEDFTTTKSTSPMAFAKQYYQGKEQQWNTDDVEYFPYNWKLNSIVK